MGHVAYLSGDEYEAREGRGVDEEGERHGRGPTQRGSDSSRRRLAGQVVGIIKEEKPVQAEKRPRRPA